MAFASGNLDPNGDNFADAAERSPEESNLDIPRLKLSENAPQPVLKLEHGAPTGAFSQSNAFDDNSGLPIADDPLGIIGAAADSAGTTPFNPQANAMADGIFFAETQLPQRHNPQAAPQNNDDILGLFRQPELAPAPAPLLPDPAQHADQAPDMPPASPKLPLLQQPPAAVPSSAANNAFASPHAVAGLAPAEVPEGDDAAEEGELVFDVKSIQAGGSVAAPVKVIESSKQIASGKMKKMRRIMVVGGVSAIVLLLALAGGVSVYKQLTEVPENTSIDFDQPPKVEVNWNLAFADRDIAYRRFYDTALERLKQSDISDEEKAELQGKTLIDVVLASAFGMSVFNEDSCAMLDTSAKTISSGCVSQWCAIGLYSWGVFRKDDALAASYKQKLPASGDLLPLIKLINMAAANYHWNADDQTYDERMAYGQKMLDLASDGFDWKAYPLAARIKAAAFMRMGRFGEARQLVSELRNDKNEPLSPALALLEFDINAALGKTEDSAPLIEWLKSVQNLTKTNKTALIARNLLLSAVTSEDVEFFKTLDEFFKTNAANPDLLFAGVRACSFLQAYAECGLMLTNALKDAPNNLDLRKALVAVSLLRQGIAQTVRPDAQLPEPIYASINDVLAKGLKDDPQQRQLWQLNAALQYAGGKDGEAVKAFDEVERGEKIVWFGAFLRQLMDYRQAKDGAGREQIAARLAEWAKIVWKPQDGIVLAPALRYVGKTDEAKELIDRVYRLFPDLSDVLRVRFDLAIESKDLELAEDSSNRLRKHHAFKAQDEYRLAKLIEELGDGNRALENMLGLIARVNDNADFLLYVGELFFKQGRCDSAVTYFDQSVSINPNLPESHYYKGRCLYEAGKYEEALTEFTEAGTQDEGNHLYALWNGLGLQKIGHDGEALVAFSNVIDEVLKIDPKARKESDIDNAALAYSYRASLKKIGKQRSDAYADFKKAIELRPQNPAFREGYIIALYENGRIADCSEQIDALLALPDVRPDSRISFIRGIIALKAEKRKEALAHLEQSLADGFAQRADSGIIGVREPVEIYERLGYLYRDMGKRDEARKYLSLLLEKSQTLSPSARHDIQNDIDKI